MKTIANALQVTAALLRAMFADDLAKPRKGGKTTESFENVASRMRLPAVLQRAWQSDLLGTYKASAEVRRDLTEREQAIILASDDVAHQGLLPCGEPAQTDLFITSAVRITADDFDGEQLKAEVRRFVQMVRETAQREGVDMYVRYQPNVASRDLRKDGNNAVRARFGGRLYAGDQPNHAGILVATVTQNEGERTALGKVEWHQAGFAR